MKRALQALKQSLEGELFWDEAMRILYATDASAYRELPQAVARPKNDSDVLKLIHFAQENNISLIPRAAGTSLAGQVVGDGIVVDVSKFMTEIIEINVEERWVRVQPGVVRDELNRHLKQHNLFFAPETSTANRATIGGMIGNNSCGSNSVVYGSTRDHLLSVKAFLSDGSEVIFEELDSPDFDKKLAGDTLESQLYSSINQSLSASENQKEIRDHFPKFSIPRRNTGYAVDLLLECEPFGGKEPFNFCNLIAGSEGTLAFVTEAKLSLQPLPPQNQILVCGHFQSIDEALRANLIALQYQPYACELMDHYILECTKNNSEQRQNRFFVEGDPAAILVVSLRAENQEKVQEQADALVREFKDKELGYHFPLVTGEDANKVWELRKAGLGLLSNMPGDAKPAPVIEDTAVDVQELPEYIREFNEILKKHDLYSVHYAHAGSGELHLRPILNLKNQKGQQLFRIIAEEIAALVKKYQGSLSGEHGDGRLRGEFIQQMIGEKNYALLQRLKQTWDPQGIFNPGKIVDTPPMDQNLRFEAGQESKNLETVFDWSGTQGFQRAAEQCNGSGDCRKSALTGGTMCPSYMATRDEKHTTRARANILREIMTRKQENPLASEEIAEVMDLCLSCKGCKTECPSNVDLAKMKAEFQHHYYQTHGIPRKTRLVANFARNSALGSKASGLFNFINHNTLTAPIVKKTMGFAAQRDIPKIHPTTLRNWFRKNRSSEPKDFKKSIFLFCDEFTNYLDVEMGIKAIRLLWRMDYHVEIPDHEESGRTFLSKGLLNEAKRIARQNIHSLSDLVSDEVPLIGLEPSAILTLRDEYLDLAGDLKKQAEHLASRSFLIDEFLATEMDVGNINSSFFTDQNRIIKFHGHCHQKALSSLTPTKKILSLPENYEVHLIRSGCCGMAGSFGYEKEHYEVSMQIGELVLFPEVRKQPREVLIAAPGTSCRHQIWDGTQRKALHPVEILFDALE